MLVDLDARVEGHLAVRVVRPARELVALAGGLGGEDDGAVRLREHVHHVAAGREEAAVGVEQDAGLLNLGPLGVEVHVLVELGARDERVVAGAVVGPACELVALAGRVLGEHDGAVGLHGDVGKVKAGGEEATVGVEQNPDFVSSLLIALLPCAISVDRKRGRRHGTGSHKQAQTCSDSRSWSCIFHKHSSFGAHERGRFSLRHQPYAAGGSSRFAQYIR